MTTSLPPHSIMSTTNTQETIIPSAKEAISQMWPWIVGPKEDEHSCYLTSCIPKIPQRQINEAAEISYRLAHTIAAINCNLNSEYCSTVEKGENETKIAEEAMYQSLLLQETLAEISDTYGGTKASKMYCPSRAPSHSEDLVAK